MRTGIGYDAHRLVEGRDLILCGEKIPHAYGLDGHSDADVGAHALMDALLGAAALGDIGQHFPPTDERYKDANSLLLLENCVQILRREGFAPVNVDITIICEAPKLAGYIQNMRRNLANAMYLSISHVSVKATTTERMGFCGSGEGMAALATALIRGIGDAELEDSLTTDNKYEGF